MKRRPFLTDQRKNHMICQIRRVSMCRQADTLRRASTCRQTSTCRQADTPRRASTCRQADTLRQTSTRRQLQTYRSYRYVAAPRSTAACRSVLPAHRQILGLRCHTKGLPPAGGSPFVWRVQTYKERSRPAPGHMLGCISLRQLRRFAPAADRDGARKRLRTVRSRWCERCRSGRRPRRSW